MSSPSRISCFGGRPIVLAAKYSHSDWPSPDGRRARDSRARPEVSESCLRLSGLFLHFEIMNGVFIYNAWVHTVHAQSPGQAQTGGYYSLVSSVYFIYLYLVITGFQDFVKNCASVHMTSFHPLIFRFSFSFSDRGPFNEYAAGARSSWSIVFFCCFFSESFLALS